MLVASMDDQCIRIRGARQNNLKGLDLDLPLRKLIVITGLSGSGKSSLAFDTVYAEGQRRYVETFSPYARQFLDRMDKPQVDRIEGIPPAIAIDQVNPVRTSRSTVGTMTELNDHLKLLFGRMADAFCPRCGERIRKETPATIVDAWNRRHGPDSARPPPFLLITFPVTVPGNFSEEEIKDHLAKQGYTRVHRRRGDTLQIIQDRVPNLPRRRARTVESLEAALKYGRGAVTLYGMREDGKTGRGMSFSAALRCANCGIDVEEPAPHHFSFNSPVGACETCRGFGRTMGIDYDLVVPDATRSLAQGAIKPWQSKSFNECQVDLMRYAKKRRVPTGVPWAELSPGHRAWVIEGEGDADEGVWYGATRFFKWLEGRSYRMHVRVMLSRYRAYRPCAECGSARLKPQAQWWRVGSAADARRARAGMDPFIPVGVELKPGAYARLPGLSFHEVMLLPLDRCRDFFDGLKLPAPMDEATDLVLREVRTRLHYLTDVGLGYLTLDRQSRTLSGGEVQRINLTTALGTSLVNTLFVLDEPSIGLHTRDMERMIRILHRLRDAGNSLLVVEHDPAVIRTADRVLDLGPGPGEAGGHCTFFGTPDELVRRGDTVTAKYLRGDIHKTAARARKRTATGSLELVGASENNLREIDVTIPLNQIVCITGVSGSGKSTLVETVLYRALLKAKHKPSEAPGRFRELKGHEQIDDVVLVDQSPVGRTARSNPASYVGALTAIRKVFAGTGLAKERGYTQGTFSFNSGLRCPSCEGCGFEHVEMQFLSDVYLRCEECNGTRYRPELLEVRWPENDPEREPLSMAEVLELTVDDAMDFFANVYDVVQRIVPLLSVGLGYMRLGQPVPTLSGGEAQRLKLAAHLVRAGGGSKSGNGILFLFDEPTTGLHLADIDVLMDAFHGLCDAGHSLVIIEHHLDVIRAADWIIDLGPEGGDGGGRIVCAGRPDQVAKRKRSHTGAALRGEKEPAPKRVAEARPVYRPRGDGASIHIHNAREHNLKGIDLRIPRDRFTVITGMSGSGKSTVAFDILFAEGQRRYLESLNAYARQFVQPAARPDVDAIVGIPPTVAIEQRTSRGGWRSTVATLTELYHFLRLLYVKLGVQHCPDCDEPIRPQTPDAITATIQKGFAGKKVDVLAPLIVARKGYYTDLARWAAGRGYKRLRVDGGWIATEPWPRLDRYREHDIELPVARLAVTPANGKALADAVAAALHHGKGVVMAITAGRGRAAPPTLYSSQRACVSCGRSFPELDPRLFSFNSRHGWCPTCEGTGREDDTVDEDEPGGQRTACRSCGGSRLSPEATAVRFRGLSLAEVAARSIDDAARMVGKFGLKGRERSIARDIVAELAARLSFLQAVGLGYLTLDRAAPTLSGGEAQRIRLAAQLGSNLRGVVYILDEPTIGLHPRDNRLLLDTLESLRGKGNTVVVVEHDEDTMERAEHLIDLGPGAGRHGGSVIAAGTLDEIRLEPRSLTGRYLASPLRHPTRPRRKLTTSLTLRGANLHNLKYVDVEIPLRSLVVVTGVSGSGKSTLVREVLHDNLSAAMRARRGKKKRAFRGWKGCEEIDGIEEVKRVLEVDQTPIGKTPRSCPATYVGFWDDIRKHFAQLPEARLRGYTPSRFSFNVKGGRCDACEGQGQKRVAMSFLPDVKVPCEVCRGRRFTRETCDVLYKGKSIADVLDLSIEDADSFFEAIPTVHRALRLLQDVGLGYLTLGQQSPTLSGGEAQRIKLVTELAKAGTGPDEPRKRASVLYVLDEPTVGLHMADVERLIDVLHRLADAGNTVVVIEHNLDIIAEADRVIDLGPEGGDKGGRVVAHGTPEQVARARKASHTAKILSPFLKKRKPGAG